MTTQAATTETKDKPATSTPKDMPQRGTTSSEVPPKGTIPPKEMPLTRSWSDEVEDPTPEPISCPKDWKVTEVAPQVTAQPASKPRRQKKSIATYADAAKTTGPASPPPSADGSAKTGAVPAAVATGAVTPVVTTVAAAAAPSPETISIRVIDPSIPQVYRALAACGLIRCDHAPPDAFKTGSDLQLALYSAFYDNPRGIKCSPAKTAVNTCWKTTTTCIYARLIAIIYELSGHSMTREKIEAIDFFDFRSMYGELVGLTGNHWFGVYPIYENARIHIETFSHQCSGMCPIANIQRELRHTDQKDRKVIQEYATDHMMMYKHMQGNGPQRQRRDMMPTGDRQRGYRPVRWDGNRRRRDMMASQPTVIYPASRDMGERREEPVEPREEFHRAPEPTATEFPGISISDSLKGARAKTSRGRRGKGARQAAAEPETAAAPAMTIVIKDSDFGSAPSGSATAETPAETI